MATITKTRAGTYKAIIRRNNKILKTKTFKLKKHARDWAKKVEGDADLIKLYGSAGALVTFHQLANEYEKWWSPGHNTKVLSFRLGFWRDLFGDTRIIDIDSSSIRCTQILESGSRTSNDQQDEGHTLNCFQVCYQ